MYYSLIFAGMARVRCGRSIGRDARPAVWCRLNVCSAGGMRVARNRRDAGVGRVRVRISYPRRALRSLGWSSFTIVKDWKSF